MKSYCAFLRGVNVNGRTMKMADVCEVFRGAGMADVVSILASGNVVFRSEKAAGELRPLLERAMSERYASEVHLFVKDKAEVDALLAGVPFAESEDHHVYAFVCEAGFEAVLMEEFGKATPTPDEKATVAGGSFYWQCRKGETLDSGFSKILGRKALRDKLTSRNVRTIAKVAAKMK